MRDSLTTSSDVSAPKRILVVDDEPFVREVVSRWLSTEGYLPAVAASAEEALALLARDAFGLILTDVMMPGKSGLYVLEEARRLDPDVSVVMMTGVGDLDTAITALKKGAYGYLLKPLREEDVVMQVIGALHRRELEIRNKRHRARLEKAVAKRATALRQAISSIAHGQEETIRTLGAMVEARDYGTDRHAHRVAAFSRKLGMHLGLPEKELRVLVRGAYLHDIGKVAVPDRVLLKPGPLTAKEWGIMKAHSEMGHQMVGELDFLGDAVKLVRHHHEHWDGSGYPEGLQGEAIPLPARIFAIADALDAMVHNRPYRKAMSLGEARVEIDRCAGSHLSPECVQVFHTIPGEVLSEFAKE